MRLLNTNNFEFGVFYDEAIPPYVILSHRWRADEVSYQDLLARRKENGTGFEKIRRACKIKPDTSWIWIDTCCIDKESSAELSEAINSMWAWYSNAKVCIAFLDDVPNLEEQFLEGPSWETQFRGSEWFTRGWTLQELLAPKTVEFFSMTWTFVGSKKSLCADICQATGIRKTVILHTSQPEYVPYSVPNGTPLTSETLKTDVMTQYSAAEKLSWMANRKTSRAEDVAYCLLGVLGINMPLLYGEGMRAFVRLQEELIKLSNDESIFAWSSSHDPAESFRRGPFGQFRGGQVAMEGAGTYAHCLADEPSRFASCGRVRKTAFEKREPSVLTNIGLRMDVALIPIPHHEDEFLAPLNCGIAHLDNDSSALSLENNESSPLALHLTCVDPTQLFYVRKGCVDLGQPEFAGILSKLQSRRFFQDAFTKSKRVRIIPSFGGYSTVMLTTLICLAIYLFLTQPEGGVCLFIPFAAYWLILIKRQTIFISRYPLTRRHGEAIGSGTLPPVQLEPQGAPSPPFGDSFAFIRRIRVIWLGGLYPDLLTTLVLITALGLYLLGLNLAARWYIQRLRYMLESY